MVKQIHLYSFESLYIQILFNIDLTEMYWTVFRKRKGATALNKYFKRFLKIKSTFSMANKNEYFQCILHLLSCKISCRADCQNTVLRICGYFSRNRPKAHCLIIEKDCKNKVSAILQERFLSTVQMETFSAIEPETDLTINYFLKCVVSMQTKAYQIDNDN